MISFMTELSPSNCTWIMFYGRFFVFYVDLSPTYE